MRNFANALAWLLVICLATSAASLHAGTVIIGANADAPLMPVDSVSTLTTPGNSMAGIRVTVNFAGGGSSTASWVASGATTGQASGAIGNGTWTLALTGDSGAVGSTSNPNGTAINSWILTNSATNVAIASVSIDGTPASVVFDRNNFTSGHVGTPNSNVGIDHTFSSESGANSPYTVNVTYSRRVIVSGAGTGAPCQGAFYSGLTTSTGCGDLFGQMSFSFTAGGPFQAGGGNAIWRFYQDTDFVVSAMRIISITRSGSGALLNCHGIPGAMNRIEASSDSSPGNFATIGSVAADGNGNFQFTDPNPGSLTRRLYRVVYP